MNIRYVLGHWKQYEIRDTGQAQEPVIALVDEEKMAEKITAFLNVHPEDCPCNGCKQLYWIEP